MGQKKHIAESENLPRLLDHYTVGMLFNGLKNTRKLVIMSDMTSSYVQVWYAVSLMFIPLEKCEILHINFV